MFSFPKNINLFRRIFYIYFIRSHIIVELGNRLEFIENGTTNKIQKRKEKAIGMLIWDFDLTDLKGFDTINIFSYKFSFFLPEK
jgi:hypothetical protein